MNFYSQYGEDKVVAEIFGDRTGNLLDIGAWAVKDLSNSRAFIEAGWSAVLCEFSPKPVRELVQEYANCADRVKIIQAAVVPIHQHCLEFQITDDALSATPGSDTARKWGRENAGGYFGRLWVPTVPLKDIINQFFGTARALDYVSIDTEGTSVDLLLELLGLGWRPKVIVCEHDGRDQHIWDACRANSYEVRERNETNVIMVRR